jgi:uncharacterized membrane protein
MALAERVPVARISAEAREIRFVPALLTLVAGLLFGVGWLAAKACTVAWAALTWTFAAVRVGWQEGMARSGEGPGEGGPG